MSLIVNHQVIAQDLEGYLCNLTDWSVEVAEALALSDELTLTAAHWEVIYYLREFYQAYQHTPAMRALVNALKKSLGPEKGNSIYLQQLFPQGPAKQASKIAGLPKPSRCI